MFHYGGNHFRHSQHIISYETDWLLFFLVLFFIACAKDSSSEKFQSSRKNIVDVRGQIVAIELENPGISLYTYFQIVDKYLVFADWKGYDNLIHLFDKNNFEHVVSTGTLGQGPNDITHMAVLFLMKSMENSMSLTKEKENC